MPIGAFRFRNSSDRPATPRIHYWPLGSTVEVWASSVQGAQAAQPGQAGPLVAPGADDDLGLCGSNICKLGPIHVELTSQNGNVRRLTLGCTLDHYDWAAKTDRAFQDIYLDVTGANGAYKLSMIVRGPDVGENGEALFST